MVDSYRWLPRSLASLYQAWPIEPPEPRPFTSMTKPTSEATLALLTTAGLYVRDEQEPFDLDRERREPAWGDPSFRAIPADTSNAQIGAAHLHYKTDDVLEDVNIALPLDRARELVADGELGALAPTSYSTMGFQLDQSEQLATYVPQIIERMRAEDVDAVLLTPT